MPAADHTQAPSIRLLDREWVWCAALAGASALLYLSTFSTSVAGGDAPESVAGVDSIGILHAPGYPAYVLAARLFAWIVPVGDITFRVNLFSTICAVGAVVLAYLLGRSMRVPRAAAALGALVMATATSFWFYATFAKFYALTSLLLLAVATLILRWIDRGDLRWLVAAAVCFGLTTGASYQVSALALPGFVVAVAVSSHPRRWTGLGVAAGVAAAVSASLWAFVLVRAGQDPEVHWGDASTVSGLVDLMSMRDFGWGSASLSSVGGQPSRLNFGDLGSLPSQVGRYLVLFTREFSVLVVGLAAVGAAATRRRLARPAWLMLVTIFATNVVGALVAVGVSTPRGFTTGLRYGGFLLAACFVVAIWAGVGGWVLADAVRGWAEQRAKPGPRRERHQRLRRARAQVVAVGAVGAVLVVAPPAAAHWRAADQPGDVVAQYTEDVFDALPEDAVLVVWGAEAAFLFQYAQVVQHARPDVDVVMGDVLPAPWYRARVADRLGLPLGGSGRAAQVQELLDRLRAERPVFLDLGASQVLQEEVRSRPLGLVNEVIDGEPGIAPVDVEAHRRLLEEELDPTAVAEAGRRWPYRLIHDTYVNAHFDLAKAYSAEGRTEDVIEQLEAVLRINPANEIARHDLEVLQQP